MNRELYSLLINGHYFTHSIGRVNDKDTFRKLELILKMESGAGLYSKDSLRKLGYNVKGRVLGNIRITKDCYVSLFDPTLPNLKKKLLSSNFSTLFPLGTNEIIFLIDSSIEELPETSRNDFDWHEVIVKDHVSIDYFRGVIIPNIEEVKKQVLKVFKKYNFTLPIYFFDGSTLQLGKSFK